MKLASVQDLQAALQGKKRLLGLDVGVKYLGVAVSDAALRIAIPTDVLLLSQSEFATSTDNLTNLVKQYDVAGFVIGYPLSVAGLRCTQAVKVDDWVTRLRKTQKFDGLFYSWEDERFTSKVSYRLLKDYDISCQTAKHIADKLSAVQILQAFLDRMNRL